MQSASGRGEDDHDSRCDESTIEAEENDTKVHTGEQPRSVDGHANAEPSHCTKSGEIDECRGLRSRWRGSRSQYVAGDARLQSRRDFVQVGEHLRGHPQNSFLSSHPSCGFQQSSLSAAGSVRECLNENYNDSCRPAIMSGHEGGPPGKHTRMYRHVDVCMSRHGRARWRGHVWLKTI